MKICLPSEKCVTRILHKKFKSINRSHGSKENKNTWACMIVFSHYPEDVRVRYEAEALVEAGMSVDIICLKRNSDKKMALVKGVNVYRINIKQDRGGKLRYVWQYFWFIFSAFQLLSRLHLRRRYQLVHVHNMPDILIISSLFPRLTGAKIILDLHDPMPELFRTIYSVPDDHPMITALKCLEKFSIRFADLVITPNISFRNLFISRGCPPSKIHIIMNSPHENIFTKNLVPTNHGKGQDRKPFALMLHGTIEKRQGQDIAVRAVSALRHKIPGLMLHIYGDGSFSKHVQHLVDNLNLQNRVIFHGSVPIEEIAKALATIDIGIVPNKRNPFTELNFPTRIFECLIMGKPVIVPRTQGILDYFDEESLFFFEPDNVEDLARQIIDIYKNPSRRQAVLKRGMEIYYRHCWELQREKLIHLVQGLLHSIIPSTK